MSDDDQRHPHLRLIPGTTSDTNDRQNDADQTVVPMPGGPIWPPPPGAWSAIHDLTGQTALILGTAERVATAIATGLADHGARIAIAERDLEQAKLTAKAVTRPGNASALAMQLDPGRPEQVRRAIAAVEQIAEGLDVLIVTVSLAPKSPGTGSYPDGLVLGETVHLVRAAARRMAGRETGGRILVLATGVPSDSAQAAMVIGGASELVRTMAAGLMKQRVTVTGLVVPERAATIVASADISPEQSSSGATAAETQSDEATESRESSGEVSDREPQRTGEAAPDDVTPGDSPSGDDRVLSQTPVVNFPTPERQRADSMGSAPASGGAVETAAPPDDSEQILQAAVAAALLLTSPSAQFLTGQVITIGVPTVLGMRTGKL